MMVCVPLYKACNKYYDIKLHTLQLFSQGEFRMTKIYIKLALFQMFRCSCVWGLSQACDMQLTLQVAVVWRRKLGEEGGHDVGTGGREDA